MRWLSPGRLASLLLFALLFLLPTAVRAQDVDKQSFETIDKVTIQCDWYPSTKKEGTKAPTVMLLHKIGGNRKQMTPIAEKLQEAGFAVLSFDFRGHGDSTRVDDKVFWNTRANMNGVRRGTRRDVIDVKSFSAAYLPMLLQDIAAAKFYLEQKNNARECNVNDLVLVGAEDGATLGAVWIYTEWERRKTTVDPMTGVQKTGDPEGKDIAAAVWLSIRSGLGKSSLNVDSWFSRNPIIREKVGFCFMFGADDSTASKLSLHLYNSVLRAEDPKAKLKLTYKVPLQGTKLAGHELLKQDELKTEEKIVKYLKDIVFESRKTTVWDTRDTKTFPLVEVPLQRYGLPSP